VEPCISYRKGRKNYMVRVTTAGLTHTALAATLEEARALRDLFNDAYVEKIINGEMKIMPVEVDKDLRACDKLIRRPWK